MENSQVSGLTKVAETGEPQVGVDKCVGRGLWVEVQTLRAVGCCFRYGGHDLGDEMNILLRARAEEYSGQTQTWTEM